MNANESSHGDLLHYQRSIRFPHGLEREFRKDYASRTVVMQRFFIASGILIYALFGILDYYAMPRTHETAWSLRILLIPFGILLFLLSFKEKFHDWMYLLINSWLLGVNLTILVMVARAQQSELAFTYYPIGLMLVLICGYGATGHLWYASGQGWLVVAGYLVVAIFDQRMPGGPSTRLIFFTIIFFLVGMNIIGLILGYLLERTNRLAFLQRQVIAEQQQETEKLRAESEQLLLNILPATVAERLKRGQSVADYYDEASILFADLADFTPFSANRSPVEIVAILNRIFSDFDQLTEKYGLEKIKTIGDAYMVVSGVPTPRPNHLEILAEMALEMQAVMENFRHMGIYEFNLRIGIHTGPVIAGIIGTKKFSYDLWGDTVNVASRMETFGVLGKIQVTSKVYNSLKYQYQFKKRGLVYIKGKGEMPVYILVGRKKGAHDALSNDRELHRWEVQSINSSTSILT